MIYRGTPQQRRDINFDFNPQTLLCSNTVYARGNNITRYDYNIFVYKSRTFQRLFNTAIGVRSIVTGLQ